MSARKYVSGFLIDPETDRVALVRKNRPAWQAGRLNAIGGKIEPGETPIEAMRREFFEETGVFVPVWDHFATINDFTGVVYMYRCLDTDGSLDLVSSVTDENIEIHSTTAPIDDLLPVITWLLPLALYRHGDFEPVIFTEANNILSRTAGVSA